MYGEVAEAERLGQWITVGEWIEYTRTDGSLVSIFQYHKRELQQRIVALIYELWSFCGPEVLKLNKKVIELQS
jgi:hypothetical protein